MKDPETILVHRDDLRIPAQPEYCFRVLSQSGDLEAKVELLPFPPVYLGYIFKSDVDRTTEMGAMGRRQKERATQLLADLEGLVRRELLSCSWQLVHTTPSGSLIWKYQPEATEEQRRELVRLAARVWHGSYPSDSSEKYLPTSDITLLYTLPERVWYPATHGLEFQLDPLQERVKVRRKPIPASEQASHQQSSKQEIMVYGNKEARHRGEVAYTRTRETQAIPFTCKNPTCGKKVIQHHFPGREPCYCSDECREEMRRLRTRQRVQNFRRQKE